MSLEQQVTALVASANALTGAVNGKINQIDSKVNNAINEITETITSNNLVTYYVDADNGNDANSGSSGSPLKTIKKALTICPTGSTSNIYLKRYQRHLINSSAICYALSVSILPWGSNNDMTQSAHYDASTPIIDWNASVVASGGVVIGMFKGSVVIEAGQAGSISFQSTGGKFTLARSKIIINRPISAPFIGDIYDYVNAVKISLRDATIVKTSGFLARSCCILSADSIIGATQIEDIVLGASRDNTLTNMNFSA